MIELVAGLCVGLIIVWLVREHYRERLRSAVASKMYWHSEFLRVKNEREKFLKSLHATLSSEISK